ncbi:S8 family peptidase [Ornithinimicrobium cerasi]|uniref:Subtilase family protein n=1 Tax=Ornithinimicrobium cerasi TaxID=2248773 RepID=A0A285VF20_9MICO|nr:S8 family serine peptidase [Ornithinimicrobium cerasi]SOC52669.1 Subtilase family protein [Ornithinimicrobium cerasi]
MRLRHVVVGLGAASLLAAGAAPAALAGPGETTYILVSTGQTLPRNLDATVARAGGTVTKTYPFGVAVVEAGASFRGVAGTTMVRDAGFDADLGTQVALDPEQLPPASGNDDPFFDLQWGHVPVGAVEAWDDGVRGEGVRVAVLDTGFDTDHPDLAPNVNLDLSADFTGEGLEYTLPDTFSHGTHVAGTIAAADNAFGTIGVAPEAELVLVKVLGDAGSGNFEDVFAGIAHATAVDADVINMSLGDVQPRNSEEEDITALSVAMNRAVRHADQNGTTVVVSAGNDAQDLDGDGNLVRFLTSAPHAIGVSAYAPTGWVSDGWDGNFFVPASYTNYGTSMVDFSGPGGDTAYPGDENCTVGGLTRPCWVFDLVFSTGNGGWYWSAGTSMAAPHAASVAALIISEHGGDMKPAAVEREMRLRAIDAGKPGTDDFHGRGAVHSGH